MSIISAYNEAWENKDVDALAELIHDDCVFNPHVGGVTHDVPLTLQAL